MTDDPPDGSVRDAADEIAGCYWDVVQAGMVIGLVLAFLLLLLWWWLG